MRARFWRSAWGVGACAGLGVWSTLGSLDHAAGAEGAYRVAMLPSVWSLVAALVLGGIAVVALVALLRHALRDPDGTQALDAVRPLAAGGLLVLPYLPWLADRLPMLVLLARPGAWVWWGLIAGQIGIAAVTGARRVPGPRTPDLTPASAAAQRRRWTTGIFLTSVLVSGTLADRFIRTPLFPGGDEPHYLIIAQSLWRDGDLRIENNHQRLDYDEYFHLELAPHYLTRGVDREIYSIHPIGMPVLMSPVYAAGGYEGVVSALVLLGAAALTMGWRLAWAVTGSAGAATFAWAVLAFGVPWVFNTFAVYPEVPAAAATLAAFTATSGWHAGRRPTQPAGLHVARFIGAGVALAALPWFSTKYAVMAGALGLVVLGRLWLPWPAMSDARRRASLRTCCVGIPCAVSLAGWFVFFKKIWGTWSPAAPYGSQQETRLDYLPQGGPGLLFDQEYGIVLFAPALLMVLPGLLALWRRGDGARRLSVELTAVWAGLLAVVGAFHIWWGGSAVVGRPVIAAMPLLLVPIAAQWGAAAASPLRRATQCALLWAGIGMTVVVAGAQEGLLLVAGRDGSSQLLEYLAPASGVWTLLPTFLRQSPGAAALLTLWWVVPLLGAGVLFQMIDRRGTAPEAHGRFGHAALRSATVSVVLVGSLSGLILASMPASTPRPDLTQRGRVRLLDEYDRTRRPLAVRYTPMTVIEPLAVPPLFPLTVNRLGVHEVDDQTQLFGKRLSLPAGRYAVDVVFAGPGGPGVTGALAVQVGRAGAPHLSWNLDLSPPATWGRAFDLPVDAGFVGFKATPDVVAAGPQIRLTPQVVTDAGARPSTRGVLSSGRYGDVQVFVSGDDAWPEPDGVWVRGRTTAEMTLVLPPTRPLTIDLRAGPRQIEVVLELGGDVRRATLNPGTTSTVAFLPDGRARPLRVSTSDGFVPADVEAGSRDRRLLGCWLTFR